MPSENGGGWRVLPSLPLACQTSALLVSYTPRKYTPGRSLPPAHIPQDGDRSIYFAFRGKVVRASGNAPDPGTHLVRFRL